jgi:hypothetical protein
MTCECVRDSADEEVRLSWRWSGGRLVIIPMVEMVPGCALGEACGVEVWSANSRMKWEPVREE